MLRVSVITDRSLSLLYCIVFKKTLLTMIQDVSVYKLSTRTVMKVAQDFLEEIQFWSAIKHARIAKSKSLLTKPMECNW